MNDKTIENLKDELKKVSKNENHFKMLNSILEIELKELSSQEKDDEIKELIDMYLKSEKGAVDNDSN